MVADSDILDGQTLHFRYLIFFSSVQLAWSATIATFHFWNERENKAEFQGPPG